jgi:hypothetical protein
MIWLGLTVLVKGVDVTRVIQLAFGLSPPNNIRHIFRAWVHNMNSNNRQIFLVGICVILCAIWLSRNNVVFNRILISSYIHVILGVLTGQEHG